MGKQYGMGPIMYFLTKSFFLLDQFLKTLGLSSFPVFSL